MRNFVVVLTWVVVGCNSTTSSIRSRFATERACPESQVDVTTSGGTQYRASGCGQSAAYVCEHASMSASDVRRCAEEDARSPRRPPDQDRPTLPPADPRVPMP
ncbi:MAG TPA: hypothetical protein VF395_17545 [Polyangiaceae bacterium]